MKRSLIKQAFNNKDLIDSEVLIKGWVRSLRKSKSFCFIILNDGTTQGDLQIIADESLGNYEEFSKLGIGSSLGIKGKLVQSEGKGQSVELQASEIEIFGGVDESYPLQKKGTSLEFLRNISHLRSRTNTFGAVFRLRHVLAMATHEFFSSQNFYYLNSPILTGVDAEGAGEVFQVTTMDLKELPKDDKGEVDYSKDYFGKPAFLCVTGQLEGECFASCLGSVYTFGPTFRSENSNTTRHLSEFWMVEPEVAFADLEEIADLGMDYIRFLIKAALEKCPDEMAFFQKHYEKGLIEKLEKVIDSKELRITYTDAIKVLQDSKKKFEYPVRWEDGLQTEHERYLCEVYHQGPVIVTDYPKEIKAFYMLENEDGKTVRAMDVLVPGVGELIGGSQREHRLENLKLRMKEEGLKEEDYWWFLDLRKYGTAPHSGFGLGFERAIMYISGMSNIRDVIPFARTPKSLDF